MKMLGKVEPKLAKLTVFNKKLVEKSGIQLAHQRKMWLKFRPKLAIGMNRVWIRRSDLILRNCLEKVWIVLLRTNTVRRILKYRPKPTMEQGNGVNTVNQKKMKHL